MMISYRIGRALSMASPGSEARPIQLDSTMSVFPFLLRCQILCRDSLMQFTLYQGLFVRNVSQMCRQIGLSSLSLFA